MAIHLTEAAAQQIEAQLAKRGRGLGLRVGIRKVGCSGLAYTYDYADEIDGSDRVFEVSGTRLVIDAQSLAVLDGSTLDFVKEGLKQTFKWENPNVEGTCGCGESFSVKGKATA